MVRAFRQPVLHSMKNLPRAHIKGCWGSASRTTCKGPIGRSVLPLLGLLARLLPLPCSLWMMLSISAISRERRKPANQDRSRSAPAGAIHTLRAPCLTRHVQSRIAVPTACT